MDGLLVAGLISLTIGVGMGMKQGEVKETKVEVLRQAQDKTTSVIQVVRKVQIDISGEVVNPGVYELNEGARVNEVLVKAGGLSVRADREWVEKNINRAAIVSDGEKIFIPKAGEVMGTRVEVVGSKKVSLNRGTVADFETLKGIGPIMAQKIVDYRQKQGGFVSIEEIKLVSGVGEKLYEKIKDELNL